MKKSMLTFAAIALALSFTSCKEVSAEITPKDETEVIETITPAPLEAVKTPVEVVVDSTSSDTLEEPGTAIKE